MTAGRPLSFDPERALDRALDLFWERGYGATSLQELTRAMGLSKSSFYQTFGSKHRLMQQCIARYRARTEARLEESLERASSARAFIEATLSSVLEEVGGDGRARGCLVVSCANEMAARDRRIGRLTGAALEGFRRVFARAVERGRREGDVSGDADPRVLSAYLVAAMCGLRTMVKAGVARDTVTAAIAGALRALD